MAASKVSVTAFGDENVGTDSCREVADLTPDQVELKCYLEGHGLVDFWDKFRLQGIRKMSMLARLQRADLDTLGLGIGDRLLFQDCLEEWQAKQREVADQVPAATTIRGATDAATPADVVAASPMVPGRTTCKECEKFAAERAAVEEERRRLRCEHEGRPLPNFGGSQAAVVAVSFFLGFLLGALTEFACSGLGNVGQLPLIASPTAAKSTSPPPESECMLQDHVKLEKARLEGQQRPQEAVAKQSEATEASKEQQQQSLESQAELGTASIEAQRLAEARQRYQALPQAEKEANDKILWEAAKKGHLLETKRMLEEAGADVNTQGSRERRPLWWAAYFGHLEVAKYLVSAGADTDAKDKFGQTALMMAEARGHAKLAAFLWARDNQK